MDRDDIGAHGLLGAQQARIVGGGGNQPRRVVDLHVELGETIGLRRKNPDVICGVLEISDLGGQEPDEGNGQGEGEIGESRAAMENR